MRNPEFPVLGYGLGYRPTHFSYITEHKPKIDWFEIISENYMDTGGRPRRMLDTLRADYPVVMHGVSLSIGTVDPLNSEYLKKLKTLADEIEPAWISDHLCWTGVAHKNTHDLLPVPYTEEALSHIIDRIKRVQDALGRRIILENPSTYLEFTASSMSEWEFIARMAQGADCGLLLDVNNIYVSCYNHKWDPKTYIDSLPLDRVQQIHLAGHMNKGTYIIDTHDDHVIDEVWALYRYVIQKGGFKNTMIEWDDKIPDFPIMMEELDKARHWATAGHAPCEFPHFQSFRHNMRPAAHVTPYSEEIGDMQSAILSGQGEVMNPQERIVPKADFSPEQQIQTYINGYRYRLFDIVFEDYPALCALIGKEVMDKLIWDFIEGNPSDHFNVARYVEKFPAFAQSRVSPLAYEMCVLETALSRLFDAQETEVLTPQDLQSVELETFLGMKLHPRAALKLFAFSYPVNALYQDYVEDKDIGEVEKKSSFLAVFRHNDTLWRLDLEEQEYMVLSSLFAGMNVGDALESAAPDEDAGEKLVERVGIWFSRWMANGLLAKFKETQLGGQPLNPFL